MAKSKTRGRFDIKGTVRDGKFAVLEDYYMKYFCNIACTMLEWHNMGKYFDARFAEAALFYRGWVTVGYDPVVESYVCGDAIAPGTKSEESPTLDIYGNYTASNIVAINGYARQFNATNSVIIYNDMSRAANTAAGSAPFAPYQYLAHVVEEMAYTHESKIVNLSSMGMPMIFIGSDKQRLAMQLKADRYMNREPFIMIDREQYAKDDMQALNTGVQCWLREFDDSFERARNEGLTYLGVNNALTSKKERLIVDEVNANNAEISTMALSKLLARNNALEKLNLIYGTDCYVTLRQSEMPLVPEMSSGTIASNDADDYEYEAPKSAGGEE